MRAFKDCIEDKKTAVKNAKLHRKQDMLISGSYGKTINGEFKGCSVGCTYRPFEQSINGYDLHGLSEPIHGIPRSLTTLRDKVFEGLPNKERKDWHVDFNLSINIGADLSTVTDKLMYFILTDKKGISTTKNIKVKEYIESIVELYRRKIKGDNPSIKEWRDAAAVDAAVDVVDAAADAAVAAAYAASYAAADAADAASYASAARVKFWIRFSIQFKKILKETK